MTEHDIVTGGYYFYTERGYGSDYADSLIHVIDVDGTKMAHPVCVNVSGEYVNEPDDGLDWGENFPVSAYYDERCWHETSYTKECGDPSRWMSSHYPVSK